MQITKEAILHTPKSQMCYVYDAKTLHLRLRSKKGEVEQAILRIGDPFLWAEGGLDGGNLGGANASGWIGAKNIPMRKEYEDEMFDVWFAEVEPENKRSRYMFLLENQFEKILYGEKRVIELGGKLDHMNLQDIGNCFCFPYLHNIDVPDAPEWAKNMVWYQIFPDRFNNGDKSLDPEDVLAWGSMEINSSHAYTGGDIQGIIDKLDYLQDLGVTGLYFCPVFLAASNHRYDTVDYYRVDPMLGSNKLFRELVDKAHAKGMKVMMDAVFNHIGVGSEQWQDVVTNGSQSCYADWFYVRQFPVWPKKKSQLDGRHLNYETFGCVVDMPKMNTENEDCRNYLLDVARYWIEDMDCDGWRLDVANEVDHVFWRDFKTTTRKAKRDSYILGEIWHDAMPWLRGEQFDAVMNYPLTDAIMDFFILGKTSAEEFKHATNRANGAYPRYISEMSFNLLESHDTSRVMGVAEGQLHKVKLAYAFLFSNCGSPCIFQGGEFGLDGIKGNGVEHNRECMPWDDPEKQNTELWQFVKKLIGVRKNHRDFGKTQVDWIYAQDDVLALMKGQILLLFNTGKARDLSFNPDYSGSYYELLTDTAYELSETVLLEEFNVLFLRREPAGSSDQCSAQLI